MKKPIRELLFILQTLWQMVTTNSPYALLILTLLCWLWHQFNASTLWSCGLLLELEEIFDF
jgi:hypothetical protein